ncbi:MAG: outer membrane protein transport protein [Bdellovibrionales bacterium]|nr:outer membrane protein transport protein [Bdellovibrionales bacterium]
MDITNASRSWKKYCCSVVLMMMPIPLFAQGVAITGVGPSNRAVGGVGVAMTTDATGALHTNPATISSVEGNEADLGLEMVWMNTKLGSSLSSVGLSGEVESSADELYVPSLGVVWGADDTDWTFGVGAFGVAGFSADYEPSATSPISAPPQFGGLGNIIGSMRMFQVVPTVAYQVSDDVSIGFAPTLSIAQVRIEPMIFGPAQPNGTYTTHVDESTTYGGGFQVGVLWKYDENIQFGGALKSPQWFEDFDYTSMTTAGGSRSDSITIEYPMIASLGVGYSGACGWTFGVDTRYFFYSDAAGFGDAGFRPDGSSRGLGWDNVFAVAVGAEYAITDDLQWRVGYSFNENPISAAVVSLNAGTPLIQQHGISTGFGYRLTSDTTLSLATIYVPSEKLGGPLQSPFGEVPGSEVEIEVDYSFSVAAGVSYQF